MQIYRNLYLHIPNATKALNVATVKLILKTQEQFGDLSLDEKNKYLQDVARQIANIHDELEPDPLGKEALSRLRRFYMRRRFSDLALEKTPDLLMRHTLKRLSDAVHLGEVKKLIKHETPTQQIDPQGILRDAPLSDSQMDFFVPATYDAPFKDDVNLMDIAPFSLGKNIRKDTLRYELSDAVITVEGGSETGLATCFDYDIFLHMVTCLTSAMKEYRIANKKGLRASLPPRCYRPSVSEILTFIRRGSGGRQYETMENTLDRLQATRIKITNLTDQAKRRESESFPLIGRYKVVSRTKNGKIERVEIDIPDWVYQGVVNPEEKPSVLTLHRDYFLIAKPLARFIYRLSRKSAGTSGIADYGLETFFVPEGQGIEIERMPADRLRLVVAVADDGRSAPLRLMADGEVLLKDSAF